MIAEPEHVVVISAHSASGLPCSCDLEPRKLRNFFWKQRLLYFSGTFQLLLLHFESDSAAFHCLLELDVTPLQPLFCTVVQKRENTEEEYDQERKLPPRRSQVEKRLRRRWSDQPYNYGRNQVNRDRQYK